MEREVLPLATLRQKYSLIKSWWSKFDLTSGQEEGVYVSIATQKKQESTLNRGYV